MFRQLFPSPTGGTGKPKRQQMNKISCKQCGFTVNSDECSEGDSDGSHLEYETTGTFHDRIDREGEGCPHCKSLNWRK